MPACHCTHLQMKPALAQFQKLHNHLVGHTDPSEVETLFNQISLGSRILMAHYRRCAKSAAVWRTCIHKSAATEEEIAQVSDILKRIVDEECEDQCKGNPVAPVADDVNWAALAASSPSPGLWHAPALEVIPLHTTRFSLNFGDVLNRHGTQAHK